MATADSQGIMALPTGGAPADTGAPAQPQLGLDDSYDAVQQGLQNASPDAHSAVNAELAKLAPMLDQLPDDVLDMLLQIIQYMHANPKDYAKAVQELITKGVIQEGDFPEEFDPEFLATFGMVIMHAKKSRQGSQQAAPMTQAPVPPLGMARGGIAEAAHMVASRGRGQDTMLAHITPKEAKMLRSKGGMGTINPATGLPEYGMFDFVGDAISGVGKAVSGAVSGIGKALKSIVSSPLGRVLATVAIACFVGPAAFGLTGAAGAAAQMAIASGAVTAMGGGNIGDVLKSAAVGGATAFFSAPGGTVSNFVGGAVSNAAANAAVTSGIVGTGMGLLSGQKLEDAVKGGLTAGAVSGLSTGFNKGFTAQVEAPSLGNVSDMAKKANVEGKWNNETGQFDPPGTQPNAAPAQNANADVIPSSTKGLDPNSYEWKNATPEQLARANQFKDPLGALVADERYTDVNADYAKQFQSPSGAPASSSVPTATDPLGDFIQQNDMQRAAANTPAQPGQGYQAPTIGQSFKTMGGGIADIAQGDFSKGFEGVSKGAGDLFFPDSPTAEQVHATSGFKNSIANGSDYNTAYQRGADALGAPGMVRTYAPGIAAGLGVAGLAGAFTPKPSQPTPEEDAMNQRLIEERARIAANPGNYVPKGLEKYGIVYNDRGEITGSNPWNPAPAPGSTEVAGSYMPYTPSPYMTPSGAIGGGLQPLYQPYNTANMYTNLMPRHAADGGMMDAAPVHMSFGGDIAKALEMAARRINPQPPQGGALTGAISPQYSPSPAPSSGGGGLIQNVLSGVGNTVSGLFKGVQPAIAQAVAQQQAEQQAQQQAQQSSTPPPAPVAPLPPPTEVTRYQQQYDPNQVSDLSRRLYPSIYDQSFKDSILSNTAVGPQRGGGIASLATGGYPRRTGPISGPGTGTSDSIPAMLSDGEFVMTAKAVRGAGKGSRLAGAKKMYALMHQLERNAARG